MQPTGPAIQGIFGPKAVRALDSNVCALTIELMEAFRSKGVCEFVSEFALQLPLTIFLRIWVLSDEDRNYLRDFVERFASTPDVDEKLSIRSDIHADL